MKTELSIEQSAKLIELGVDPKLASKCLLYFCDEYDEPLASWDRYDENGKVFCATEEAYGRSVESRMVSMDADFDQSAKEENPIFDLSDILTILPKEIEIEVPIEDKKYLYPLSIKWHIYYQEWRCYYTSIYNASELIDALYQLLCWCLKERYVKPKTEEK